MMRSFSKRCWNEINSIQPIPYRIGYCLLLENVLTLMPNSKNPLYNCIPSTSCRVSAKQTSRHLHGPNSKFHPANYVPCPTFEKLKKKS